MKIVKALHCPNCPGVPIAPGVAALPGGAPYLMGRSPDDFPFRYVCAICHQVTVITAGDFARLPELTIEELERIGALAGYLKDLLGAGYSEAEARHLFMQGHDPRTAPPPAPAPPPEEPPAPPTP